MAGIWMLKEEMVDERTLIAHLGVKKQDMVDERESHGPFSSEKERTGQ